MPIVIERIGQWGDFRKFFFVLSHAPSLYAKKSEAFSRTTERGGFSCRNCRFLATFISQVSPFLFLG